LLYLASLPDMARHVAAQQAIGSDPQYLTVSGGVLSMRRMTRLACVAAMTMLFSGCQQMAWKPGASSSDLDRDTAACEAGGGEQAAVHDCLRKRGWVVRVPKPADEIVESTVEADTAPVAETGAGPLPAGTAPAMPATGAAEPGSGTAAEPRNKSVPAVTAPKPVDPLRRSNIQAWWKMGGQGDALSADMNTCVETLGILHKPDLEKRLYTRGLIDCLKGKGWYGK
jgi:hypothetical protein